MDFIEEKELEDKISTNLGWKLINYGYWVEWGTHYKFDLQLDKKYTVLEFIKLWLKHGEDFGYKYGEIYMNGYCAIKTTHTAVIQPSNFNYNFDGSMDYGDNKTSIFGQGLVDNPIFCYSHVPKETLRAKVVNVTATGYDGKLNIQIKCKYRLIDKIRTCKKLRIKIV